MKHHERMTLTPLELAVWAAAYMHGTRSITMADHVVDDLRKDLEHGRQRELLDDAKVKHHIRIVKSMRSGAEIATVRCSCGYEPPSVAHDVDEMMALHLTHVRALGPEDVP